MEFMEKPQLSTNKEGKKVKKHDIKGQLRELNNDTHTAVKNFLRLIEAISLLTVSVFSYLVITDKVDQDKLSWIAQYIIFAACVVIGVRGALEFIKYLANKE